MRRDNPHISKRRGGRKLGHRKFSLQAFHAKHIVGSHHSQTAAPASANSQQTSTSETTTKSGDSMINVFATNNANSSSLDNSRLLQSTGNKLPVLDENVEGAYDCQLSDNLRQLSIIPASSKAEDGGDKRIRIADTSKSNCTNNSHMHRHERINENHKRNQSAAAAQQQQQQPSHRHNSIGPNKHHHHHHHNHNHHHHNNHRRGQRRSVISADPVSSSSVGGLSNVYHDVNDEVTESQSSGNVSPQRQSSIVCSQSSIHPEESSEAN